MPEIDPWKHATFIYACYLIVGFCVGLLTVWYFRDEATQRQRLEQLEAEMGRSRKRKR